MTMTTIKLLSGRLWVHVWSLAAGCAVALAVLAGGISPLPAQSIACMVNGEPITSLDIEQRTKLNFLTTRKQMPRQEVLDELTNSLESQGVRPETLKARLKAEMVWSSLVRGRFKESLQVGEKDVNDAAQGSGEATQA